MPRMEDQVDFLENVENVVDTEQDKTTTQENDGTTNEDTKHCSWNVGEPYDGNSNKTLDFGRKPNETLADLSALQINLMNECKDNDFVRATDPRMSSLPSNAVNQEEVFRQEARRRAISGMCTSNHNRLDQNQKGYGNMTYTSLENEMRERLQTVHDSKKVNDLQLKTMNPIETLSKASSGKKNDCRLSSMGIHEEALELSCTIGDWIIIDLDSNVYEMKQAQDVTYLREKRKRRNRLTILGRCCFIL